MKILLLTRFTNLSTENEIFHSIFTNIVSMKCMSDFKLKFSEGKFYRSHLILNLRYREINSVNTLRSQVPFLKKKHTRWKISRYCRISSFHAY